MTPARLLAVIPAYNEARGIGLVVTRAREYAPVLVVDDGSTDETTLRAEAAGATVLLQTPNQGKGAALRAGFRWALQHDYDAVITLDADGQHNPAEIPGFVEAYTARGGDLIIGARDFAAMPLLRRLANTSGGWVFSWAVGQPVRDNQSGYRLLSRRMLHALLDGAESGFEFEMEMIVTCVRCGYDLAWTPIQTIYAGESSHIRPWQHTRNFCRVAWNARRVLREQKTSPPGEGLDRVTAR